MCCAVDGFPHFEITNCLLSWFMNHRTWCMTNAIPDLLFIFPAAEHYCPVAGTVSIWLRVGGWVGLSGWLHSKTVHKLWVVTHLNIDWVWHRVTTVMFDVMNNITAMPVHCTLCGFYKMLVCVSGGFESSYETSAEWADEIPNQDSTQLIGDVGGCSWYCACKIKGKAGQWARHARLHEESSSVLCWTCQDARCMSFYHFCSVEFVQSWIL